MKSTAWSIRCILTFLTVLVLQGVSFGQSLYDVVISLSDRQRVISQRDQVRVYFENQNSDPSYPNLDMPADFPIDWLGVGTNPTQSAVDGLDIGGKIALLNQAVTEFDRLKFEFLNSSPDEYASGSTVGSIKPHASGDFAPLPRATPENHNELLTLLAQRVRALRLILWPAAFREKSLIDETDVREVVVYDDPLDSDHNDNREPRVEIHDLHNAVVGSVSWKPGSIGPGSSEVRISDPATIVTSRLESRIDNFGYYSERPSGEEAITAPLRTMRFGLIGSYPEEARVSATAPGADGTQIGGTVYVLRRSIWHQLDVTGVSSKYEKNEAGYVVDGASNAGSVSLFGSQPSVTFNGSWVTRFTDNEGHLSQDFVEGGYQYKEASILPSNDPGYSDNHINSYEKNWDIGCMFISVFKPTFTRGVDDTGTRTKLELTDGILADNAADGSLLLHPRPSLFFGIDLGPGLKGGGNGYISTSPVENDGYGHYGYYGDDFHGFDWDWDDWDWDRGDGSRTMIRFDSSYSLQFAGSCSDYHVVYENDRSTRTQSLPADGLGWAYTDNDDFTRHDTKALYRAWDRPRLKQVAGKYLVADIEYNSNHYGGYTIKVYRRPTGDIAPTPGQVVTTTGTPIRTWIFSHPGATPETAHPNDPEKLEVTGNAGEKYEIQTNEVLPNQGLGWVYLDYWYNYFYDWWRSTEGTHSWTLKLSQGATEKLRKDIVINTTAEENGYTFLSDVTLTESVDGQEISSLFSLTLDPFSDQFPADWEITSGGKTIIGSATLDYENPVTRKGKLPTAVTINYDGIQPDVSYTWNSQGLLSSATQGPWSTTGVVEAGAYKQTRMFNGNSVATKWTEFLDGGNKVKTYSAPDGNAGSKSDASVAWREVEYGTASNGMLGLPHIIKKSDGTSTTYNWAPGASGAYVLTAEGPGGKVIKDINTKGQPNKVESFTSLGGNLKTGGSVFSDFTAWGIPKKSKDFNSGLESSSEYDEFSRLTNHTDGLGASSGFTNYDLFGRAGSVTTNGITATKTFTGLNTHTDYSGEGITGSADIDVDPFGRLLNNNKTWNGVTDNLGLNHGAGNVVLTRDQGYLGTHTSTVNQSDGTVSAASGPTIPFGGTNGEGLAVENGLLKTTSRLGEQSSSFNTIWTDAWGRVRKTETPSTAASGTDTTNIEYSDPDSSLKRVRVTEPSGRKTITESDSNGALTRSGIDVDGDGTLGYSDRYVESETTVSNGKLVTILKQTEDSGMREILQREWTPSGNVTVTKINGSEETITRTPNYTAKTITTSSTKGWSKTEGFNNLGLTTSSTLSGTGIPTASLTPTWRADGSLAGMSFTAAGDTHSATFKNDGTLASLTVPGKGNILGGHSISGGVESLTVDGVTTVTKLDGTEVTTSGGDVIGKNEKIEVTGGGFKQTTTPALGAATTLTSNAAGAATSKSYAAGNGESYEFGPGGLLKTVTLARGGELQYGYSNDGAKDLISAVWPTLASGPFSIPVTAEGYDYDRAGRVDEIGDCSGIRALAYHKGRLSETAWNSGPLAGHRVVNHLDPSGRDIGFTLYRGNEVIHSVAKAPNGVSGEISGIASGSLTATFGRDAARNLTSITRGSVIQNWTRGVAGCILSATNNVTGAPTFDYRGTDNNDATAFDAKGRRLKCATAGGEWTYTYGIAGQLTSATHPTLGTFNYAFDGIGRRTDMGSANTSDLLNQTLAWTNNQNKTLKIAAHPDARVWLNGSEIPNFNGTHQSAITSPGASGGWVPWNTLAVLEGQGDVGANADAKAEKSGAVWVPPSSESFSYDLAGNRQSSALWDFGWDAKNQLVRARTKNHDSAAQGFDVTNEYDSEGRRFKKSVTRYQSGTIIEQKITTFLWDGWDLIYEREQLPSGLTTLERKYVWGPDIAGGNAGGAGGLLLIRETRGNATIDLYPLYDGTGHVIALADSSGTLQAEYAYGPFGELIHAKGPYAQSNPFRYATKYFDAETGLYYFGKRHLDPVTGQWLSREPLGESESLNLYSYCHNDPVNNVDVLGLEAQPVDAVVMDGIPTMVYQDWAGSGLAYLWNAFAGDGRKTWHRSPNTVQLRRAFYFEDGAWHARSPEARRHIAYREEMAQIPAKMEEIGPYLEAAPKIAVGVGLLPALGTVEVGAGIYVYGGQALNSAWAQGTFAILGTQAAYEFATDEGVRHDTIGAIASDPNGVRATGELLATGARGLARMGPRAASLWEVVSADLFPSYGGMKGFAPGKVINPFWENSHPVVRYSDKMTEFQNHHGIMDKWATENIFGYASRAAGGPATRLSLAEHNATRRVFTQFSKELTGKPIAPIPWKQVSPRQIQNLSEEMFDAAGVSGASRDEYYRAFNRYIYTGKW